MSDLLVAHFGLGRRALTLNGTPQWATAKELQRLGETRTGGTPARVRQVLERIGDAIADTSKEVHA